LKLQISHLFLILGHAQFGRHRQVHLMGPVELVSIVT